MLFACGTIFICVILHYIISNIKWIKDPEYIPIERERENKIDKQTKEAEKILVDIQIKIFEDNIDKDADYQELFINTFDVKASLKWTNIPEHFKVFCNNNNNSEQYISFYKTKLDAQLGEATRNYYMNIDQLTYYETKYGCVCVVN